MKFPALAVALLALPMAACKKDGAGGAGDEPTAGAPAHESLANEIMDSMGEFADSVSSITDVETAKSASTEIATIAERFATIAAKLDKLEPAPHEVKVAINAKMEARDSKMQEVVGPALQKQMQELPPEAAQILQQSFSSFFAKMDESGAVFEKHFSVDEPATAPPSE